MGIFQRKKMCVSTEMSEAIYCNFSRNFNYVMLILAQADQLTVSYISMKKLKPIGKLILSQQKGNNIISAVELWYNN